MAFLAGTRPGKGANDFAQALFEVISDVHIFHLSGERKHFQY